MSIEAIGLWLLSIVVYITLPLLTRPRSIKPAGKQRTIRVQITGETGLKMARDDASPSASWRD